MEYITSNRCKDHFDFVINDSLIYNLPNSPDRWPDVGNGAESDPDDAPPIKRVKTSRKFAATQPTISVTQANRYVDALNHGANMPPVAALKCKDGIIAWNGHHRVVAHRVAGRKTIKVRFWAELDCSINDLVRRSRPYGDDE